MTTQNLTYQSLPGPGDITRAEFPNGITLLTRSNFNSQSVTIKGYLQAGSISDPADKLGLAAFTADALMTGTHKHAFKELHNQVESLGASMSFSGGALSTGFSGMSLAEDLPTLLDLMLEVLNEPTFPEKQYKRLKAQFLTMLSIRAEDPADMAALTFDRLLYKGHPYENPEDGYAHTVEAISRQDLAAFHQKYYGPRGMVVAIVGAVEPGHAIDLVAGSLAKWQKPNQAVQIQVPDHARPQGIIREHVTINGKSQTDLIVGTLGPNRLSPYYRACLVGNNILGQFGMMGRIGESLREKAGLAYYAQSEYGAGLGPSSWEITAGVNPDNVERALQLIHEEIGKFIREPVGAEELADTKSFLIGHLPLTLESNFGVAISLLNLERYQLGLDYLQRFPQLVDNITASDILNAAQKYWALDHLVVASAGSSLT